MSAWLHLTLSAMQEEAAHPSAGSEAVTTRLADLLVIGAVRIWLQRSPEAERGWLGGLGDPHLGGALALMHRRSEEAWTVVRLAAAVGPSRSVFCERFRAGRGDAADAVFGQGAHAPGGAVAPGPGAVGRGGRG